MRRARAVAALILASSALGACAPTVPIEGAPCPCPASGYCCVNNACVQRATCGGTGGMVGTGGDAGSDVDSTDGADGETVMDASMPSDAADANSAMDAPEPDVSGSTGGSGGGETVDPAVRSAFPPVGPFGFVSTDNSPSLSYSYPSTIGVSNLGTSADTLDASLGYFAGPTTSRQFAIGFLGAPGSETDIAGTVACTVYATGAGLSAGAQLSFESSRSILHGAAQEMVIATDVPAGAYFYSAECTLPPNGQISVLYAQAVGVETLEPQAAGGFLNAIGFANAAGSASPVFSNGSVGDGRFYVSLGRVSSSTGFRVFGYQAASTPAIGCTILGADALGGTTHSVGGQSDVSQSGPFSFDIPFPSNWAGGLYQAVCDAGDGSSLYGIAPIEAAPTTTAALFPPVSGAGFSPMEPPLGSTPAPVTHRAGLVWVDGSTPQAVMASLGHGRGGLRSFNFAVGVQQGSSLTCVVTAVDDTTGASYPYVNNYGAAPSSGAVTVWLTTDAPAGPNYFYSAACTIDPGVYLAGVSSSNAIYDPAPGTTNGTTQCTVGGDTMHCCPAGYAMIGARTDNNLFKCAPLVSNAGAVQLDTSTQRNGMHSCPYGQVMVGLDVDGNKLACQALPADIVITERVDTGTQDEYPMHVCDALIPRSAMSGINVLANLQTCVGDPLSAD